MDIFQRTELLFGEDFIQKIQSTRIILFGVGGVGSWCAETLVRMGVGHLCIVDSDLVSETNINRQLLATTKTVGQPKVKVLKQRLLEINPEVDILALQEVYAAEYADRFQLNTYDFIIDAIDSLSHKAHLIQQATQTSAVFFSSMGAALKTDPSMVKTAEFWKVHGCPLAAALRTKIRKQGGVSKKFLCVFSDEIFPNQGEATALNPHKYSSLANNDVSMWDMQKVKINGTSSYMPAIFGLTIAGLVAQAINKELNQTMNDAIDKSV